MKLSVGSVQNGHQGQGEASHAMVLDRFDKDNDMLVFKNTYDDPENGQPIPFTIARTDPNAPEELYFVHIEIKDMDSLPNSEPIESEETPLLQSQSLLGRLISSSLSIKWFIDLFSLEL